MRMTPELDRVIKAGLVDLYNLKYEDGLAKFQSIQEHKEEHPIIAYAIAAAHWWRLSVLVLEPDEKESQAFLDATKECVELCERKMKEDDLTGETHLAIGGVMGLYGRWLVTNRSYVKAYFRGKKAYKYLVEALEINPQLSDANMGKGIFEYYVATLPKVIQVLAFIGTKGDKETGLKQLHDAADNGIYSEVSAKLFLIDIYARGENRPDKSLEIVQTLKEDYPQSPFVKILEIISYYNYGSVEKLEEIATESKRFVAEGIYPSYFKTQVHFAFGIAHMKKKEWKLAEMEFTKAIKVGYTKDAFHSWSILYRGYACDAQGKREEAIENYKEVLNQLRRWESWDNAKNRIKNPFEGTEEDLAKLTL